MLTKDTEFICTSKNRFKSNENNIADIGSHVVDLLPAIAAMNVAAYALISSEDKQFILQKANYFLWALIPIQMNAVLNSIIYVTRNSHMRNYYYKLFTCANEERNLESAELFD